MLKNYLKIAVRNILQHKLYTFTNVFSLSVGLAALIIASLYLLDEFSYDTFQKKSERIYRIASVYEKDSTLLETALTPYRLGQSLQNDYPKLIENYFRLLNFQNPSILIEYKNKHFNEKNFFITDSSLFEIFNFDFLQTQKDFQFSKLNTVVISQKIKDKYFGTSNPIDKEILIDGIPVKVIGVFKNLPKKSHVRFDILVSFKTFEYIIGYEPDSWLWNACWTYIVLDSNATASKLQKVFPEFIHRHYDKTIKNNIDLFLQPIPEIHLNSELQFEINPNNKKLYLFIIVGVAAFLLLISIINFISLRMADSLSRIKENGIRKILGASRMQLIFQFLIESSLLSLASLIIAFFWVEASLPVLNYYTGKNLDFTYVFQNNIFLYAVLISFLNAVISGINAGLFASSYPVIFAIRFKKRFLQKKWLPAKFLILMQYILSLVLLINVLINFKQLHYLKTMDLGFDIENIVIIPVYNTPVTDNYQDFKKYLSARKQVQSLTALDNIFGNRVYSYRFYFEKAGQKREDFFPLLTVRSDFLKTFNIKLLAGTNFSLKQGIENNEQLKNELIINETLSKHLGYKSPKEAINKKLHTFNGNQRIIGVIRDFNIRSLHKPAKPLIIRIETNKNRQDESTKYIAVKFKKLSKKEINYIKSVWQKFAPNHPFEYKLLKEILNKQYHNENLLNIFMWIFSILLILISSISVWALNSFASIQRTKEIGIRKAIGAMVRDILKLFTKEYLKTIIVANIIAWFISYFLLSKWLSFFTYRISIDIGIFIIATVFLLILTLAIILFYAYKAAVANPVDALRDE